MPYFYVGSTGDGTIYRGDIHRSAIQVFLPGGKDDGPDLLIVGFQCQIADPTLPFDVVRVHAR